MPGVLVKATTAIVMLPLMLCTRNLLQRAVLLEAKDGVKAAFSKQQISMLTWWNN